MANRLLKQMSDFLARLPGLPVLIGIALIVANFVLQLLPPWPVVGWMADVNLLLHLGVVIALFGTLLPHAL